MNAMATIQEKVLDHFIKLRKKNPEFYFVPRKINNKGRLDQGFWFIGNEYYMHISFWNGMDWKEKINNIGFVIHHDRTCKIELSAQDSEEKAVFLEVITHRINGFIKDENKNKWYKNLNEEEDYMALLDQFLANDKPVIDALLAREHPPGILSLDKAFYDYYIKRIIDLRQNQIEFGSINKITRITWNTEKWQRPSGSAGKSVNQDAYEARTGYGHEEWLLDKTAIIDSYHYAFIQCLNLETAKHVGNLYNITMFTANNLGKKYEVGTLRNVECISKEESERLHKIYLQKGWIRKMETDLSKVNADIKKFRQTTPDQFFNIRFRFEDAEIHEELLEISDKDVNITTNHFKLLPRKSEQVNFDVIEIDDGEADESDENNGNKKNTSPRKRAFNVECEYDPYHDKMQNLLFEMLNAGHEGYYDTKIEKGRVDIKARHTNGKWHYFEIKTDGPKLSIRKALGQIMEYAYYPSLSRAEKLLIIADEEPDNDAIEYLKYIREKFKLPVYYRALNIYKRILSKEF